MAPFKRLRPAVVATGLATVLALLLLCGAPVRAAGLYLPAGDGALRSDLTLLIDAGVLDLSAMAWPLPRADLERALAGARIEEDSPLQTVLERVRRAAVGPGSGTVSMRFVAGHPGLLRDFETAGRQDGSATLAAAFGGTRWSTTLVVAGVTDPADHHALRFDGSELTLRAGNWLLGVNALDRWWGPGQQGSLILSSNARPLPALMLDRATALAPEWRILRWVGPWRFTALAGQAEGSRQDVSRPYFMGMRFEMRPTPWMDFAAQRTALFCGEGRQCGSDTIWKMLVGHDNRGINTSAETEPGDGLAGFDLRLKLPGPLPAAFYTQWIGEDVHGYLPVKFLGLFGVEASHVNATGASLRGYVEYSDTTCAFNTTLTGGPQTHYGCAYGSTIYNAEGYRYYHRSIGHTTDNDARLWVVGLRSAPAAGGEWRAKIVAGTLNRDNTDPLQPAPTNTVAPLATQYRAAELGWQNDTFLGHVGLQLGVERLKPVGQSASDRAYGFLSWERGL
jgi:hypothetical protein